jgi:hypothetical protein
MEPTPTPHDCFFCETFGRLAIAGDCLRRIFDPQPTQRLRELLRLILQVLDQPSVLELLESLLRGDVQGLRQLDEPNLRALLQETGRGEPLMEAVIERYIALSGDRRVLRCPLGDGGPACAEGTATIRELTLHPQPFPLTWPQGRRSDFRCRTGAVG